MQNLSSLIAAASQGMQLVPEDPALTPQAKSKWNQFVDYLDKSGYKGNALLDDRNKGLGVRLMNQYKNINPSFDLNYEQVKQVQQELQDYRSKVVQDYKAGKVKIDGIKSPDEFMADLSPADGWLGSKTSSHKFPVAMLTKTDPTGTQTQNFNTDIAAYDAARTKALPKK